MKNPNFGKWELRYYMNKHNYEVIGTYLSKPLAYGMKKVKASYPQYPAHNLKVVEVS